MYNLLLLLILMLNIQTNPMDVHRWKNRILILSAPSSSDPSYQQQVQMLATLEAELKDRDLIVYRLTPDQAFDSNNELLSKSEAPMIWRYFNIQPEVFSLILVGKDGGEKLRNQSLTQAIDIFSLIDTMPMRIQEMDKN